MTLGAYARASDTGRKRRRNEDSYVVAPPLFAVADGMGGAQAGEVASQLAASALEAGDSDGLEGTERVDALIQEANRRIYDRAATDPTASGMGTTMTVALVEGMTVAIGHVGDSRAYLVRGEQMEQLTEDHSLVNELLKTGKLSEEEAQIHPQRSVITRAVGTDPDVDVDGFTIEAEDESGGNSPELTFTWDTASGKNGDKLHLTITPYVRTNRPAMFVITSVSAKGDAQNAWYGFVGVD